MSVDAGGDQFEVHDRVRRENTYVDVRQHAGEGEIEEGAGSTGEKSGQTNRIRYRLWAEVM